MSARLPSPPPLPPDGSGRSAEDHYLWRAFRHHSRTFSLAARLLPGEVRLPIATLYLYCRTVDSIADERVLEVGADGALRALDEARHRLGRTLAGDPPDRLLWRRLAEVHARFGLGPGPLYELLDGAAWDLEGRGIADTADLLAYSERVAGSVGAMMLPFLAEHPAEAEALEPTARALGKAMQLTNILRDVGEDLVRLGRVYLPDDALDRFGITRADLLGVARNGHGPDPAYAALLESVMATAERLYDEAEAGIAALPRQSRLGIAAAARMYREIMNEVRAARYDNLRRRAVVPLRRKLRLVAQDDYAARRARLAGCAELCPDGGAGRGRTRDGRADAAREAPRRPGRRAAHRALAAERLPPRRVGRPGGVDRRRARPGPPGRALRQPPRLPRRLPAVVARSERAPPPGDAVDERVGADAALRPARRAAVPARRRAAAPGHGPRDRPPAGQRAAARLLLFPRGRAARARRRAG